MIVKIDSGTIMHGLKEASSIRRESTSTTIYTPYPVTIHITLIITSLCSLNRLVSLHMEFHSMCSGELKKEQVSKIFGITYCCREFTSKNGGYQSLALRLKKDSS